MDIGCGLSILGLYLRERGWPIPIVGFDYDSRKIEEGKKLIIRSGIKENNVRFFDVLAKCLFWMKAGPTHYPTAEFFHTILEDEGLTVEVTPYWGKTPFNNHLIVATRKEGQ